MDGRKRELAKHGVNLSLFWTEYCENACSNGKTSYMHSQFCDKYRHWARLTKATMRIQHKPGDAMQVDWAGNMIKLYDRYTTVTTDVYLFVAVLPCSRKAYVETRENMKGECWLSCHSRPLVLDVADIQRIMEISRVSAYELVNTPAFRKGRLINVSKIAFFEWMAKGSETLPGSDK